MGLRKIRRDRDLTQEQLAERSGVDQTTISNLETGRVTDPSWSTVMRLADALDVDAKALVPFADRGDEVGA
jgi:transcriptional regulator with XRE-family HTH domain